MKYESRKFINLILTAANWDPPADIKVGDYGTINRATGSFEWEGNIYNSHFQAELNLSPFKMDPIDLTDARLQPVILQNADDEYIVVRTGLPRRPAKQESGRE
ncbi:hypothetical protein BS17DRAFT_785511 [Gyrodon lividus]|nr:hypothetical protein BS17DRAFT_785511 [Gyrodon lividus]